MTPPTWFMAKKCATLESGGADTTGPARRAAQERQCICSHREKTEDGKFSWCAVCGVQLLRQALPKRTGKTQRKMVPFERVAA